MSTALNNVTTADVYTAANTLTCWGSSRLDLDVSGAAIYFRLGRGVPGIYWEDEVFCAPSFKSFDRQFDAVQIRSAVKGTPAQVTVHTATPYDVA